MTTKVLGADKLKRKVVAFPRVAREEIDKAMEQSAEEMVRLAKSLVSVDDGDLQMSIGWTWGQAPQGSMTLGIVRAKGENNRVLTIFAGNSVAYYARWVEFGTSPHRIEAKEGKSLGRDGRFGAVVEHNGARAKPFFYPAYRAMRKRMRGRTSRAIRKAARKAAAGGY